MSRLTICLICVLSLPALSTAQGVVVATYPAPVTTYFAPASAVTTTYSAPAPVVAYYAPAPVVTAYAAPTVSYYRSTDVVTYRYPPLRPRTTVVRTYPGGTLAVPSGPVVTSYYTPAVVVP